MLVVLENLEAGSLWKVCRFRTFLTLVADVYPFEGVRYKNMPVEKGTILMVVSCTIKGRSRDRWDLSLLIDGRVYDFHDHSRSLWERYFKRAG